MTTPHAARAGIVVTGTEVLTGRVADSNGPWLANQLREVGLDIGRIVIVGDRPEDLDAALQSLALDHDLLITTGGLGPTADDLTAERVAAFCGRTLRLDDAVRARVAQRVAEFGRRTGWNVNSPAMAAGVRKQAMVPDDAVVLDPVGTAPGLVVTAATASAPPVVVLPGPPGELRAMWPAALEAAPVASLINHTEPLQENTIRVWGGLEADLAEELRTVQDQLASIEVTTCLRDGELEIVTRYRPGDEAKVAALTDAVRNRFGDRVFATDGRRVDDLVAEGLIERGWTVATAESCTGGLLAGRLSARPGSSAYLIGAVVVYANEAKTRLAAVPAELIAEFGAVSSQVAIALAHGARTTLGTDIGVGITGIAGPDGGTSDKPVGTVHLCVAGPDGVRHRELRLRGDRDAIRQRTVDTAMHELRLMVHG